MLSLISLALGFALTGIAVKRGWLFIDFQIQIGSFIWGRRHGVKRRVTQSQVTAPAGE